MYIPNLFGAYMQGKEHAVDRNWNDLKQFEDVEHARNVNDKMQLGFFTQRAMTPGNISMLYDNVDASTGNNRIRALAQPGMEMLTNAKSNAAGIQAKAFNNNLADYAAVVNDMLRAKLAQNGATATYTQGTADRLNAKDANGNPAAWNAGWGLGQANLNTQAGQNILAANAANAANQAINQSNANYQANLLANQLQQAQTQGYLAQQPWLQQNVMYNAQQYIPSMEAAAAKANAPVPLDPTVIASYISRAGQGDQGAIYWLQQHGLAPNGTPLQQALVPTPEQQAATQAANAQAIGQAVGQAANNTVPPWRIGYPQKPQQRIPVQALIPIP